MPKPTKRNANLIAALLASGALAGGVAGVAGAEVNGGAVGPTSAVSRLGVSFSNPTRITNPWLPLSVHREAVLTGDDGRRSVRTLLKTTKTFRVDGRLVRAVAVEDRCYQDGVLSRVVLGYYAQADDGTVYRLGEDVERYGPTGRKVAGPQPAPRGMTARTLAVAMPTNPRDGQRFHTEWAAGDGAETAQIIDTNARLTVPTASFNRVLVVRVASTADVRYYARGIGLIKEDGTSGAVELAGLR